MAHALFNLNTSPITFFFHIFSCPIPIHTLIQSHLVSHTKPISFPSLSTTIPTFHIPVPSLLQSYTCSHSSHALFSPISQPHIPCFPISQSYITTHPTIPSPISSHLTSLPNPSDLLLYPYPLSSALISHVPLLPSFTSKLNSHPIPFHV